MSAIIRDCHPAAPRTERTAEQYDLAKWINEQLPTVQDAETRIYLIAERGKLTGEIWNRARKERLT